jgi:hypothetical protein
MQQRNVRCASCLRKVYGAAGAEGANSSSARISVTFTVHYRRVLCAMVYNRTVRYFLLPKG